MNAAAHADGPYGHPQRNTRTDGNVIYVRAWRSDGQCTDCDMETTPPEWSSAPWEWYDVHDRVWAAAGMATGTPAGFLCIGCLEDRLGRRLTAADFTAAHINSLDPKWDRYAWSNRTGRLVARLGDGAVPPGQLALF